MTPATPPPVVCRACPPPALERMLARSPSGTVVRVVGGAYRGHFTVGPGVTVRGELATLDGGGSGTVLTIAGPGARVSGLTIRNSGRDFVGIDAGVRISGAGARVRDLRLEDNLFGIDVDGAPNVVLQHVAVEGLSRRPVPLRGDALRLFDSPRARVEDSTFRASRDVLVWFSNGSELIGNRISDCRYGLHSMYEVGLTIADNAVSSCEVGSYLMYSRGLRVERNVFLHNRGSTGYGLGLKEDDDVDVRDNAFVDDHAGMYLDDSPASRGATLRAEGNLFAYDGVGITATPATQGGVLLGNAFVDNLVQAQAAGGGGLQGMTWSQGTRGNYWSDYAGYDATGNGIGDAPYRVLEAFGGAGAENPGLQLFAYSPASVAIDFAAHALPAFAPGVQLVDRAPVLRPQLPRDLPWPRRSESSLPLYGFAALALGGAGTLGALSRRGVRRTKARARSVCAHVLPSVPLVVAAGLGKRYGHNAALRDVTLQVAAGEAVALWGPNGAGKTTLLRCVLGQVAYEGSLSIAGLVPSPRNPAARALVGYAPQSLADFEMTAEELAAFVGDVRGCGADAIDAALDAAGFGQARRTMVGALSGGMKQRLGIALALASDPALLVLDEPTAGLDRASHRSLLELLRIQKMRGKTILFTSHQETDVIALADRVIVMEEGRVNAVLDVQHFAALMRKQREEDTTWRPA